MDAKTLARLENAVSKSEYVGAGKKLKVTNEVGPLSRHISVIQVLTPPRSTPT